MWALALGGDLFELRNTPFYAYDLNFLDVVRAVAPSPDLKPQILEVVRRSGHQTLRVFFSEAMESSECIRILDEFGRFGVTYEGCSPRYFALDVLPQRSVPELRAHLDRLQRNRVLAYETTEARVPGSFDDDPTDEGGG